MLLGGGDWTLEGFSNLPVMGVSLLSGPRVLQQRSWAPVTAVPGRQLGVGWQCDLRDLFVYSALVSE